MIEIKAQKSATRNQSISHRGSHGEVRCLAAAETPSPVSLLARLHANPLFILRNTLQGLSTCSSLQITGSHFASYSYNPVSKVDLKCITWLHSRSWRSLTVQLTRLDSVFRSNYWFDTVIWSMPCDAVKVRFTKDVTLPLQAITKYPFYTTIKQDCTSDREILIFVVEHRCR